MPMRLLLVGLLLVGLAISMSAANLPSQLHLALTGKNDSMGVSWRTADEVQHPVVQYKRLNATIHEGVQQVAANETRTYFFYDRRAGYFHHTVLTDLIPDSDYTYRVGEVDGEWSNWTRTHTVSAKPTVTMIFTGDFGLGGAGPPTGEAQCTADSFAALASTEDTSVPDADFFFVAGDIAYANMHGKAEFESTWNGWFDALEPAFSTVPVMTCPGNHETYVPGIKGQWNFTAYHNRFKMPSEQCGGAASMWYSFDMSIKSIESQPAGEVHFCVIDTETDFEGAAEEDLSGWGGSNKEKINTGINSKYAQLEWLQNDLASFRRRSPHGWLVVIGHKPFYSAAPGYTTNGEPSGESANLISKFEPLFTQFEVDLYLAGHQHGYERSIPLIHKSNSSNGRSNTAGGSWNGTIHIVSAVAGGGCGITADWTSPLPTFSASQWPRVGTGSPWNDRKDAAQEMASLGFGILRANSTNLEWTFVLSEEKQKAEDVLVLSRDVQPVRA